MAVDETIRRGLLDLLEGMTLEEILDQQNVEPEEALWALYEIGLLDLERYFMDGTEELSED